MSSISLEETTQIPELQRYLHLRKQECKPSLPRQQKGKKIQKERKFKHSCKTKQNHRFVEAYFLLQINEFSLSQQMVPGSLVFVLEKEQ